MSTLTTVLVLVIWLLASIIYGIITMLGSPRGTDYNIVERAFLLPFFVVAWLLRIRK